MDLKLNEAENAFAKQFTSLYSQVLLSMSIPLHVANPVCYEMRKAKGTLPDLYTEDVNLGEDCAGVVIISM